MLNLSTRVQNTSLKFSTKDILFVVLIFSFILRIIFLDKYETWGDEKLSISEANGLLSISLEEGKFFTSKTIQEHNSLQNVLVSTTYGDGGNGILYIFLLHYWTLLFGNSDFSVRFLSVVFGTIVVFLTYIFSKELFENKKIALISVIFSAIHPFLILYSREARAYSLGIVMTLSASIFLLKMIKKDNYNFRYWFANSLLFVCSILSHYSTVYVFIAHFIIFVFKIKLDSSKWLKILPYAFVSGVLLSLWFYTYGNEGLKIISIRNQEYAHKTTVDSTKFLKTTLYSVAAESIHNILFLSGNKLTDYFGHIRHAAPLVILPFYILFFSFRHRSHEQQFRILFLLSFISLFYALILSINSGHIIPFVTRYSLFSSPYFIILVSLSIYLMIADGSNTLIKKINALIIFLQISIIFFSLVTTYLGYGLNSTKINSYQKAANKIYETYLNNLSDFIITYNNPSTAIEINKYLNKKLFNTKQIIDKSCSNKVCLHFTNGQKEIIILK